MGEGFLFAGIGQSECAEAGGAYYGPRHPPPKSLSLRSCRRVSTPSDHPYEYIILTICMSVAGAAEGPEHPLDGLWRWEHNRIKK